MKTKLGISTGLVGAALYFTFLFGGYTPFLILAAYVFFVEKDEWLQKAAVKAMALGICFSLANTVLGLVPDAIGVIGNLTGLFNKPFSIPFISKLISLVSSILYFIKDILFLLLGLQAIKMQDFPIEFIDKLVNTNTGKVSAAVNSVKIDKSEKTEAVAEKKDEKTEENV